MAKATASGSEAVSSFLSTQTAVPSEKATSIKDDVLGVASKVEEEKEKATGGSDDKDNASAALRVGITGLLGAVFVAGIMAL